MLPKLTSKNPLTPPKATIPAAQGTESFDVIAENGRIVLTPMCVNRADDYDPAARIRSDP